MTAEPKTIRITCKGAETLLLETLFEFQPEEFKDLTKENFAALRHTILADGFQFVFQCWRDATGKTWIIDGHQRKRVLKKLAEEGYTIPPLPVAWIEAESATKAAEALIRQNARYGMLDDGDQLAAFVAAHNVDWNAMLDSLGNTGLGELKIQEFDAGWMKDKEPPTEFQQFDENIETEYQCPKCGYKWSGNNAAVSKQSEN